MSRNSSTSKRPLARGHSRRPRCGQGVVEYSGALVIAAAIVTAGLITVPPSFSEMFSNITTSFADFLSSSMDEAMSN